jgi:hypothetical protein
MYICMYVCMYHAYMRMYICRYVCICVCMYVYNIYIIHICARGDLQDIEIHANALPHYTEKV